MYNIFNIKHILKMKNARYISGYFETLFTLIIASKCDPCKNQEFYIDLSLSFMKYNNIITICPRLIQIYNYWFTSACIFHLTVNIIDRPAGIA